MIYISDAFLIYIIIGFFIGIINAIRITDEYSDMEEYLTALFSIIFITFTWLFFLPLLPVWIINKIRSKL